jgi:hypothetical protein
MVAGMADRAHSNATHIIIFNQFQAIRAAVLDHSHETNCIVLTSTPGRHSPCPAIYNSGFRFGNLLGEPVSYLHLRGLTVLPKIPGFCLQLRPL